MSIEVWSAGDADSNMDQQILVRLAKRVREHPWWKSRTSLAQWILRRESVLPPARILDAGCGWGTTYLALEDEGYEITGLDISRQMLEQLDAPTRRLAVADLSQPMRCEEPFAAVLAMDVLEHIDDDTGAARQLFSFLQPGGLLVLSVPALPELFSEFDRIQSHRRRYTAETLRKVLEEAEFRDVELLWWGQLMYWLIRRQRTRDKGVPGESLDETYLRYLQLPGYPARLGIDAVFTADRWITRLGAGRRGTSLMAIGRRPAG
jgi:2-polyprenyl-3-methyl-5-hydroxy-6-metoxy-1,4-benzoquinol methylase